MAGQACNLAGAACCFDGDKFAVHSRPDWNNSESGGMCHFSHTNNSLDCLEGEM